VDIGAVQLIILCAGAMFAGFVDAVAGGGGIITIPLLLSVGIPPHAAIATNKLQASFGSCTAMLRYRRSGLVVIRNLLPGVLVTAIGAAAGALLIQRTDAAMLAKVMPWALTAILVFILAAPGLIEESSKARLPLLAVCLILGPLIGFYDGFFGPGTGTFWVIAFSALAGLDLKRATASTKVMNFTSNIISLTLFLLTGRVLLTIGLLMGMSQLTGAWIGSHMVISRGTRWIRIFMIIVVAATIIDLFIRQLSG